MIEQQSLIDWFKLQAQYVQPELMQHWMNDVLSGADYEIQLLETAIATKDCSKALLMQLQGMAALLCSPPLHALIKDMKQSSVEQQLLLLVEYQRCYLLILQELNAKLHQH